VAAVAAAGIAAAVGIREVTTACAAAGATEERLGATHATRRRVATADARRRRHVPRPRSATVTTSLCSLLSWKYFDLVAG
jgi:hypothetical protein